jgi:hypothetical protein
LKELYSTLWASLGAFIQSWLPASAIAVGFFSFALFPGLESKPPWSKIAQMGAAQRSLLFAFSVLILSFLLASSARQLTRLLEGYTIRPRWLRDRWTEKQKEKRQELHRKIAGNAQLVEKLRYRDQLNRYPRKAEFVLPTRLGNALRAGETFGWVQYGVSTVDLWTRLTAVADEKLLDQLDQSRAVLNFYVALIWLSVVLAAVTVPVALWSGEMNYILWVVPLVGLLRLWYSAAVSSVTWYAQGMQALADLSRGRLATALGVRLPEKLDDERELWMAISDYAAWGPGWSESANWIKRIDEARVRSEAESELDKL